MRRRLILSTVVTAAVVSALAHGRAPAAAPTTCAEGRIAYAGSDGMIWVGHADNAAARPASSISGFSPTWSPDGRRLAFRHLDASGSSVYLVNADGTGQKRLTAGTSDWSPAWSPDGARIAYSTLRDNQQELVTVAPDGNLATVLTPGQEAEYPAWSPDGSRIAFASARGNNYDIWVMNADGSARRNLTRNPAYDMYPAWSPDGRKIAFGSDRTRPRPSDFVEQDVFVMNANGSNVRNVTGTRRVAEGFPSWRADGSLTYVRGNDRAHPPTFWSADANGSRAQSLGFGGQFPAWEPRSALGCNSAPPAERLAFVRDGVGGNFDVFVGDAGGQKAVDITNSEATESFPRWSPAADRLLFIRGDRVGHGTIVVTAADGSLAREVVPSLGDVRSASWSPDGERIAFSVFGARGHVYIVGADGSGLHALVQTTLSDSPAWSPDGRFIVYRQEYPENDELVRVRLATGAVRRLTHTQAGRNDLTPAWSPDGRRLAYRSDLPGRSAVWVVDSDGSKPLRLTKEGDDVGFPAWREDGGSIVYEKHGALWSVRADGARPRLLLGDAHFPSVGPSTPEREPSLLRISARSRPGASTIAVSGLLVAGGKPIANARVQLRLAGLGRSVRTFTNGRGRFKALVRRRGAGSPPRSLTAFFAGDSTTLASVAFRRVGRGRG